VLLSSESQIPPLHKLQMEAVVAPRTTCRCHAREPHLQAPQVYLNGLESTDTVSHYSSDFRQQCPHPPQLLARRSASRLTSP
jgi:hypothetical protein